MRFEQAALMAAVLGIAGCGANASKPSPAPFASASACRETVADVVEGETMTLLHGPPQRAWAVAYDGGALVCAIGRDGRYIVGNGIYRSEADDPLWRACDAPPLCDWSAP